jgi:hypothetical protein
VNEYFILIRDRYALWAKGPYETLGEATTMAERMIEEDDSGVITSAIVCHSVAMATLDDRSVTWETSEYT